MNHHSHSHACMHVDFEVGVSKLIEFEADDAYGFYLL